MATSSLTQIPGYRTNEYLVLLNPHEELKRKINLVRKNLFEQYKINGATNQRPFLTLANFVQYEMMEERIVNRLKTIAMGFPPFKVSLKDYGNYPTHTLFINIATKNSIQNLVKQLKSNQRLLSLNEENKAYFNTDPNIILATKLQPWQFEQGWNELSHRQFTGHFIADSMLLIKRRKGEKKYQILQRFEFMNLPVATVQGELFA